MSDGRRLMMASRNGGIPDNLTYADAYVSYLKSEGYTISEFSTDLPISNQYITVPHTLGKVPDVVIAIRKDPVSDNSGYQLGCAINSSFGVDNNYNRTYKFIPDNQLQISETAPYPYRAQRTAYNFARNVTASSVELRKGTASDTKMLGEHWYLAVK